MRGSKIPQFPDFKKDQYRRQDKRKTVRYGACRHNSPQAPNLTEDEEAGYEDDALPQQIEQYRKFGASGNYKQIGGDDLKADQGQHEKVHPHGPGREGVKGGASFGNKELDQGQGETLYEDEAGDADTGRRGYCPEIGLEYPVKFFGPIVESQYGLGASVDAEYRHQEYHNNGIDYVHSGKGYVAAITDAQGIRAVPAHAGVVQELYQGHDELHDKQGGAIYHDLADDSERRFYGRGLKPDYAFFAEAKIQYPGARNKLGDDCRCRGAFNTPMKHKDKQRFQGGVQPGAQKHAYHGDSGETLGPGAIG